MYTSGFLTCSIARVDTFSEKKHAGQKVFLSFDEFPARDNRIGIQTPRVAGGSL